MLLDIPFHGFWHKAFETFPGFQSLPDLRSGNVSLPVLNFYNICIIDAFQLPYTLGQFFFPIAWPGANGKGIAAQHVFRVFPGGDLQKSVRACDKLKPGICTLLALDVLQGHIRVGDPLLTQFMVRNLQA